MKQAYRAADGKMEKKTRLIDKRKGKESRKVNDKAQFINEQDDKLKGKELTKTRASKHNEASFVVEIRIPGEKDFATENKNCGEIPEEVKTARTARSSSTREKLNEANNSLRGFFAT